VCCSILTPLVGLQVLSLERNYELRIDANIGTTITALFASLTQTGLFFRQSIQIALSHFLFNLPGDSRSVGFRRIQIIASVSCRIFVGIP
ncbi:unnamed protein product, partial [Rotaria sordida]